MKFLLSFLLTITSFFAFAQKPIANFKSYKCPQILRAGDIRNALNAGAVKKITIQCSPVGPGESIEVASGKKKDKFYFEKENNVVWVKFTAVSNGALGFRIRPLSETDDYDFLLFKDEGDGTINKIISKKLKPIRSNLARNKKETKGVTGLKHSATATHNVSGVQNEFSKPIPTKEGRKYYLVLNNVYPEGKGAIIYFDYSLTKKIKGTIKNDAETGKLLEAEVTWDDDKTGETLAKTTTDPLTGEFEIIVPYDPSDLSKKYVLSAYSEKHFFKEKTITTKELKSGPLKPINLILSELKKGKKNQLHNINFVGNQAVLLPGAYSSLKRLHKLMKKNKSLIIIIEGHTNGCTGGLDFVQRLSENRALAVQKYLIENGISENRMGTKGYNCKHMLYPNPINEKQSSLNRRVEILVTSY
jgi:outer membrane protein OmpA-like peptidoglycan-associated protein